MGTIQYLSAEYGAGKTYGIAAEAKRHAIDGAFVVIACISKKVIDEIYGRYFGSERYISVHRIYRQSGDPERVSSRICRALEQKDGRGTVLLITQQALFMMRDTHRLAGKTVIFDEIPQVMSSYEVSLDVDLSFLRFWCDVDYSGSPGFLTIEPRHENRRKIEIAAATFGKEPETKSISALLWRILSPLWRAEISKVDWERCSLTSDSHQRITLFTCLNFEPFRWPKQVLIGGAHFEQSLFFHYGMRAGVEFEERIDLKAKLRLQSSDVGSRTTIYYAHDGNWSRNIRDKALSTDDPDGPSVLLDLIIPEVERFFGEQPFLWAANKCISDDRLRNPNAIRLPNSAHGLNCYSHIDSVVFLSALNPTPSEFGFHKAHGITSAQVKTATYREQVAQGVYRSSVRVRESTTPKTIVVMDRATAEWLQKDLPGSTLSALNWIPPDLGMAKQAGRKKIYDTGADKVAACRDRKNRRSLLDSMDSVFRLVGTDLQSVSDANASDTLFCNENAIISKKDFVTIFYGTQFETRVSSRRSDVHWHADLGDHVEFLRECHWLRWPKKEDVPLFSPAYFNPKKCNETDRGLANIEFVRGIYLDNDGGDLPYSELARLFPGCRFLVWSTYNSTPEKHRWRAYFPTTTILSVDAYNLIVGSLFETIRGAGFKPKSHCEVTSEVSDGFDHGKNGPASLFHAPCQAAHPDGSFFIDHKGEGRTPIDVLRWINELTDDTPLSSIVEAAELLVFLPSETADQTAVSCAVDYWRSYRGRPGTNLAFFNFGLKLASAGLQQHEIVTVLQAEARTSEKPDKRKRQIADVIRNLRVQGHLRGSAS